MNNPDPINVKIDLPPEPEKTDKNTIFVAGIGASAGGLEALEKFFTHCPNDSDIAFVVVQHLSPDHKSMMLDLLGRYTKMGVVMVEDGMDIEPNKVFLIPAGKIMRVTKNHFKLSPKAPHTLTLPIDIFLSSLAEAFGRKSIGVILSGTGSDGSRGAIAINAAGGFLMAQDTTTAKFDGMPASVINTGLVDAILDAEQLAQRLIAHINNVPGTSIAQSSIDIDAPISDGDTYDGILQLLLQSGGIDFHDYKMATILRRIERRMLVRHTVEIESYYELLQKEHQELLTLKREMLIPVTNFFRDTDAFEALKENIIRKIVTESNVNNNVRVWVAGTSTGEEAYSIAMLFIECFEQERRWHNLKIFATDVNQDNIDTASSGIYPESIASEISEERLQRFFNRSGNAYEVKPELRQMIVFARHNLLADPPFNQMDLVSCRNTLIYFTQEAQRKSLQRLQFGTKQNGYLFLGSSESLANGDLGYTAVDAKHKLFKRTSTKTGFSFYAKQELFGSHKSMVTRKSLTPNTSVSNDIFFLDEATKKLIEHYSPPSMLVNTQNEIIHLFGNVQPFFRPKEGNASLEINRVLPENMIPVASALMFKSAKEAQRMVSDYIPILLDDNTTRRFRLSVTPVAKVDDESLLLLSFEEQALVQDSENIEPINVDAETMERVELLERELAATRESLQATIEELETSNEELQATNEELMASNEELQSSNEELQSVNEEMNTVNAEYEEKVNILNRVNADLDGMAKAVGVATVFVDHQLNLTRFSPDALDIFKLRDTDIGRPLDEITNTLKHKSFMDDLRQILLTDRMLQKEVTTEDDKLYLMRLLPYRFSNEDLGVVATFVDITAFRDRKRLQLILDALPEHIAVLEDDGTIAMVNKAWIRFAKANGDSKLTRSGPGSNYLHACRADGETPDVDAQKAFMGVKSVLERSDHAFTLQYPCHSPTEERWFVMNVAPIDSSEFAAVVSHINISAWFRDQRKD